jgi:1-phosphatidylinositol phosphodiesterase
MMITIRMVFPIPARKPRASSCAASRPTSVATRDMAYDYKPSHPAMGLTGWRDGRALSPDPIVLLAARTWQRRFALEGAIPMGMGEIIVQKAEELKDKVKQAAGRLTGRSQDGAKTDVISRASWMGDIQDHVLVTALSIPGTHDSGCIDGPMGFAKTQNLDLADQLTAGIRFLDIRLAHYQDGLHVHHDVIYMGKGYREVLKICADFLVEHPSEAILMSVDEETRFDGPLGDFAPSEVLNRLLRGEPESWDNTRSFHDEFEHQTWEQMGTAPPFYNYAASSVGAAPAFTSETSLGDVRGKIILLRRFQCDGEVGFDVTYWLDDTTTRSSEDENGEPRNTSPPMYYIEDHYNNPDNKYDLVVTHLEKARGGDKEDLYITFSSAVTLAASGYAETINPRLNNYLAGSAPGRVGIIVMDYFEEPRDLVSNVIKMNSTGGATSESN